MVPSWAEQGQPTDVTVALEELSTAALIVVIP